MDNVTGFNFSSHSEQATVYKYWSIRGHHWAHTVQLAYLLVIVVLGIPANCLVILVQTRCKHKITTDYYIATLSVVELICVGGYIPLRLVGYSQVIWTEVASTFLCAIRMFFVFMSGVASMTLLAVISIDRYMKTCRPFSQSYKMSTAKKICVLLTVGCVIITCPSLWSFHLSENLHCSVIPKYRKHFMLLRYIATGMSVTSFLVISCFYARIFVALKTRRRARVIGRRKPVGCLEYIGTWFSCTVVGKNGQVAPIGISPRGLDILKDMPCTSAVTGTFSDREYQADETVWTTVFATGTTQQGEVPKNPNSNTDAHKSPQQWRAVMLETHSKSSMLMTEDPKSNENVKERTQQEGTAITKSVLRTNTDLRKVKSRSSSKVRRADKTTRTMFIISFTYIGLRLTTWISSFSEETAFGTALTIFANSLFLFRCIINPGLYMCLSSKFKVELRKLVRWK